MYYVRYIKGFPGDSAGNKSVCNAGDLGLNPGLGRSPGEEKGYLFQYSGLENSMDCIVHGVAKSRTRLNDFHSLILIKPTASLIFYLGCPKDISNIFTI